MSFRQVFRIVTVITALAVIAAFAAADSEPVSAFNPNLSPGESITVTSAQWPPVIPSGFPQATSVGFHEFKVKCAASDVDPYDPVLDPGVEPTVHSHTFLGGTSISPSSTTASLMASTTSCHTVDDHSAYWFPTLLYGASCPAMTTSVQAPFPGCTALLPVSGIVYYKSGIKNYESVRAFPPGLRFAIGDSNATPAQFTAGSGTSEWSCGSSYNNTTFPASCPLHSNLIIRYNAASCWDGVHLDTLDHKSHMAYPVSGVCPQDHPVALPMLEFRIAYSVDNLNTALLRLSSGPAYSWHAGFFSAWAMKTQEALVTQCVNGGGQCDEQGYDPHFPSRGSVLDCNYMLITSTDTNPKPPNCPS